MNREGAEVAEGDAGSWDEREEFCSEPGVGFDGIVLDAGAEERRGVG
jgi:hypothetical protein